MPQLDGRLGLVPEAGQIGRPGMRPCGEHLQGDEAIIAEAARLVDDTHTANPHLAEDVVAGNAGAVLRGGRSGRQRPRVSVLRRGGGTCRHRCRAVAASGRRGFLQGEPLHRAATHRATVRAIGSVGPAIGCREPPVPLSADLDLWHGDDPPSTGNGLVFQQFTARPVKRCRRTTSSQGTAF